MLFFRRYKSYDATRSVRECADAQYEATATGQLSSLGRLIRFKGMEDAKGY